MPNRNMQKRDGWLVKCFGCDFVPWKKKMMCNTLLSMCCLCLKHAPSLPTVYIQNFWCWVQCSSVGQLESRDRRGSAVIKEFMRDRMTRHNVVSTQTQTPAENIAHTARRRRIGTVIRLCFDDSCHGYLFLLKFSSNDNDVYYGRQNNINEYSSICTHFHN